MNRRTLLRKGFTALGVAAGANVAGDILKAYAGALKITDLKVEIYESEIREPAYQRWKLWTGQVPDLGADHRMGVLRVSTDGGVEGICPVRDLKSGQELVEAVKPLVVGRDPLDREFVWQTLWKMERNYDFSIFTHSAIDIALWDIMAKVADLPLYKLLGAYREKIKAYRSSTLIMTAEGFVKDALRAAEAGFHGYKLHPQGDPEKDIDAARAVRAAVGDEMNLMLDPIGAYDHEGALKVARELEKLNYLWLEEPLPEWDIGGYEELCRTVDIPICGPEVVPGSVYLTAEYIRRNAVDIVRSDVVLKGGITGALKTAHLAEAFGKNIELHITYSPFTNAAQIHMECAIKNTLFHEFLGTPEMNRRWERAYGVREFVRLDEEGYVAPPPGPGVGVELDQELLGDPVQVL
ncbi:MAG: mandelate racemase [bacterium]|nr:mandelate racemase [bacterium]